MCLTNQSEFFKIPFNTIIIPVAVGQSQAKGSNFKQRLPALYQLQTWRKQSKSDSSFF